ncbi:putative ATP-grasp-modified RiPP [Streptomyces sp. NPDC056486]|uniref:putative ATP-grasp-modified RiPP n=1 Tax=Streptomyces sp. NPDC056486 TaxID=3345835 RepID=UPI0036764995
MSQTQAPWGMTRLAPYQNTVEVPYTRVELDPESQTTNYFDSNGQPVEMGGHGTSKATSQATATSADGGGGNPPPPADSDSVPDDESD